MTVADEKALLARFAKAAGTGEQLNIHVQWFDRHVSLPTLSRLSGKVGIGG
jgi:hypothetical protein